MIQFGWVFWVLCAQSGNGLASLFGSGRIRPKLDDGLILCDRVLLTAGHQRQRISQQLMSAGIVRLPLQRSLELVNRLPKAPGLKQHASQHLMDLCIRRCNPQGSLILGDCLRQLARLRQCAPQVGMGFCIVGCNS